MVKIDKDVPLPENIHRNSKYPFSELGVGDSFFWSDGPHQCRDAAFAYGKKVGIKFTTRMLTENDVEGVRVWRIK